MSDAPFFPPPTKPPSTGPFRSAATPTPTPVTGRSSRPATASRAPETAARAERIEQMLAEMLADRARAKRNALVQIAVGLALFVGGVVVTFASNGGVLWFGGMIAGVMGVLRGAVALVQGATAASQ